MGSGTVPVAFDWFGVERHVDTEIFGHTVEDVTSYPQAVTHRDTQAWSNLEFPLRGHDSGVKTGLVVSLDDIATVDFVGSHTAVVGSLGSGESILGPSEGMEIVIEQRVLLFDAEPGLLVAGQLHGFQTLGTVIGVGGFLVVLVGVAQDQTVVAQVERIAVNGNWIEENVGIAAFRLET